MKPALVATIICPHCHAELPAHCDQCAYCHRKLLDTSGAPQEEERVIDRPWLIVVLLLHVGLLGIPLYWKTRYSLATRLWICLASIVYTLVAVGIIVGVGSWLYRQIF